MNPTEIPSAGQSDRYRFGGGWPIAEAPDLAPERRPWMGWMDGETWERLVSIPPRRRHGLPHGWGPNALAAAYRRRFGASPPLNRRGRYAYTRAEIEAVAALLETEAAGLEVAR